MEKMLLFGILAEVVVDHLPSMGGREESPSFDCRPTHSVSHARIAKACMVFPRPTSSAMRKPEGMLLGSCDSRRLRTAWTPASWCQRSSFGVNPSLDLSRSAF